MIEPLAHPERFGGRVEDAFTVVVPSLPGFGFSQAPKAPITLRDVSRLWKSLMVDHLGFDSFFAQGGDMGSVVSSWLAFENPDHVAALHLNYVSFIVTDQQVEGEREWLARNIEWTRPEEGYRTQQGTRPQTLAYGLTDSPVGLAAWIIEKFQRWTLPGETRDPPFDLNQLLDNVTLYWIAGPNPPSWYYVSVIQEMGRRRFPDGRRLEVPTGVLICPKDIMVSPPDSILQPSYNVVRRTDASDGGHFVAMEQPELFLEEMRAFFRPYR